MLKESDCVFIDGEFHNRMSNQLEILTITGTTGPAYLLDFGLNPNKTGSSINCYLGQEIIKELAKLDKIKFGLQFANDIGAANKWREYINSNGNWTVFDNLDKNLFPSTINIDDIVLDMAKNEKLSHKTTDNYLIEKIKQRYLREVEGVDAKNELVGLANLTNFFFNYSLSKKKKYQMVQWWRRPLKKEFMYYAAYDVFTIGK